MEELLRRYPALKECQTAIEAAEKQLIETFSAGKKLLLCGNGGSCADCDHIVGELMKGFLSRRPLDEAQKAQMRTRAPQLSEETLCRLQRAVPAISLPAFTALNTAFCNDVDPGLLFAQPLMGLGQPGDLLMCLSTSGNSANVVEAALTARGLGLSTLGLTGQRGGRLKEICDVCICVPETETFKVQELHLPVYHYLCAQVEKAFFGD